MTNSIMKKRILFGVYVIYLVRKVKTPFIAESFALAALIAVLFSVVSVPHVIANMTASGNLCRYFVMAFFNTRFIVQFVVVSTAIAVLFFVRNFTVSIVRLKQRSGRFA